MTENLFRADGLERTLYLCPHCGAEGFMHGEGIKIRCDACGKSYTMSELGELSADDGDTEFSHIPDWFRWEREQVRAQIQRGEYRYEDEVQVFSLPRCWKFEKLGKAKLTHDEENGFVLTGHYRGQDYRIQRIPARINSLHVEYDFGKLRPIADCFDISTETDSFYCYPSQPNVLTKLAFATEELYLRSQKKELTKV